MEHGGGRGGCVCRVSVRRTRLQQAACRGGHIGGERPLARNLDGRLAVERLVLLVLRRRLVRVVVLDGPRAGGAGAAGIWSGEFGDKVLECYLALAERAS